MLRVGLSGGIGSGKSTVSRRLVERGAVLIDSDVIAREVVAVGSPGLAQVVDRFGAGVLAADGSLDRPALAATVFGDDEARAALNGIVHPLVFVETIRQMEAAPSDAVVVHDIPLLVELGREVDYHLVVIVDTPADQRLSRLVHDRGMTESEAQARIDAQATDDQISAAPRPTSCSPMSALSTTSTPRWICCGTTGFSRTSATSAMTSGPEVRTRWSSRRTTRRGR